MKIKAEIVEGKFEFTAGDKFFREQNCNATNIKSHEDFEGRPEFSPVALALKNGLSQDDVESAHYVVVWPVNGSGSGQYVTIRAGKEIHQEISNLKAARVVAAEAAAESKKNAITISISSRGWGDYSSLKWTGDSRLSDSEIVAEMRCLIDGANDLDESDLSDESLVSKIDKAKGRVIAVIKSEIEEIESRLEGVKFESLPTVSQAAAQMKSYNNFHNEGGEGYVPHVMSRPEADRLTARKLELIAKIKR